jgi:hypothetical protein
MTPSRLTLPRRAAVTVAVLALSGTALVGCAPIADAFNGFFDTESDVPAAAVSPTPIPSIVFDSVFTYDGSLSLSTDVAEDLEVRLEVWAQEPKRTQEWNADDPKSLGFAVNVVDHRVDEKAVLEQKRRVYISGITITSQTAQTSGQSAQPFTFSADPRTLVPTDTLRSDKGLLLNTYQGGLLVPAVTIGQLPADTFGITLQFALTVTVEGSAADGVFSGQTVYQSVPIAITRKATAAAAGS